MQDITMLQHMKRISAQVMIFPGFIGIFSIQSDKRGYRSLNQTTAAMPQKKQYNRLILPPRLNGISL